MLWQLLLCKEMVEKPDKKPVFLSSVHRQTAIFASKQRRKIMTIRNIAAAAFATILVLGTTLSKAAETMKNAEVGVATTQTIDQQTTKSIAKTMARVKKSLAQDKTLTFSYVTDVNGLRALKATLSSSVMFATNSSKLTDQEKEFLRAFAQNIQSVAPQVNLSVYGHTDNTGSHEANATISTERAEAVARQLVVCGIDEERVTARGFSYDYPVADNALTSGRRENRRVEVYLWASEAMISAAQAK